MVELTKCHIGVNLTVSIAWTGRLLVHRVYLWADWLAIDPAARRSTVMSFFKRPDKSPSPVEGKGIGSIDTALAADCPALACYLGSDVWEDGEVRQRSTLIVFYEEGQYKVCLSDKDTNMTLWAASKSFLGVLEALEGRLTEATPDWRKQRPKGKRG
jgi:hypothetical protein